MDEEFYCEWQALSMEDAIWGRNDACQEHWKQAEKEYEEEWENIEIPF